MAQQWHTRIWQDGRLLIFLAAFFFTIMGACVKAAAPRIPLYEIIFFRSVVSAVFLALLLPARGISFRLQNFPTMTTRSLAGFLAISCNFYAISHLALGDAAMLVLTFPIFVAGLSFLFLGETLTRRLIFLILLAWAGVALILKPQVQVLNFAGFIALLAALFASIDIVTIRILRRTEHPFRITFYFMATATVIALPIMLQDFIVPTLREWIYLLGSGIAGTVAQIAISQAYGLADVSRLSPLSYMSVIFAFIAGGLFWQELPTVHSIVGSLIVIYCCIRIARLEKTGPAVD